MPVTRIMSGKVFVVRFNIGPRLLISTRLTIKVRIRITKLTMTKKMADVHFTRMHCGRKSFIKANRRLLKDRHKAGC